MIQLEVDSIVVRLNCGKAPSNEYCSEVRCPDCLLSRMVRNGYILKQRQNGKFTGLCLSCNAKRRNKQWSNGFHPRYSGDKKKTKEGYITLTLKSLREHPNYSIANIMAFNNGKIKRILEHRWIVACSLGRPLFRSEIVHHKNGVKDDNRLENLELLTVKSHHKGHGDIYYQKWQEALVVIELTLRKQ